MIRKFYGLLIFLTTAVMIWSFTSGVQEMSNLNEEQAALKAAQAELQALHEKIEAADGQALPELGEAYRGWLTVPGTDISGPVMQAEDNEYYLSHAYDGSVSGRGSLFLDCTNAPDDPILTVHGHNLGSSGMFSQLCRFQNEEVWNTCTTFRYETADEVRDYEIFAVMVFDVENLQIFDYAAGQLDGSEFTKWLEYIEQNSLFHREMPDKSDRIMVLSTCAVAGKTNLRILVFGTAGM